jgi:hypothetical protein
MSEILGSYKSGNIVVNFIGRDKDIPVPKSQEILW